MSRNTIFFVHTGPVDIAKYAVFQAITLGLDTHVIGADQWPEIPHLRFHNLNEYDHAATIFRRMYVHASINDPTYERFCFERWFVILEIAKNFSVNKFYYADSDLLVFPKAFDPNLQSRFAMFDTAWFNFFRDLSVLEGFCNFLIDLYATGKFKALAHKYAIDGVPHLSDMHCFFEYALIHQHVIAPLSSVGSFLGYSERFSLTDSFVEAADCPYIQKVIRENGKSYLQLRHTQEKLEVRTLHFQGRCKPFISAFHSIKEPTLLSRLDRLSDWYVDQDLLGLDDCRSMDGALRARLLNES